MASVSVRVLGIDVDGVTMARWRRWFAPSVQPFVVDDALRVELGEPGIERPMALELQDTFWLYGDETWGRVVGLTRVQFDDLSPSLRARLVRHQVAEGRRLVPTLRSVPHSWRARLAPDGDRHRFVWWRDSLRRCGDEPVIGFVTEESSASQHERVSARTWDGVASLLPAARELAGTFAEKSGPNCFGTVMAATGVSEAADVWMLREPFETWLAAATRPGGNDEHRGTVLVWRDRLGVAQHAAVTLGDGWALHKPSQGWMTPRVVMSVAEIKRAALRKGHRLSRRTILPA